jgi:hypothetical protein
LTLDELKFQQLLLLGPFIKQVCHIIHAMGGVNFTRTQQPSGFENIAYGDTTRGRRVSRRCTFVTEIRSKYQPEHPMFLLGEAWPSMQTAGENRIKRGQTNGSNL